jgi:hypothetical protein
VEADYQQALEEMSDHVEAAEAVAFEFAAQSDLMDQLGR